MKLKTNILAVIAVTVACGFIAQQNLQAKQGATDPIPGTSKGATNSGGGGGGKSSTPAPAPAPAPAPVTLPSGPITFTASGPVNGTTPVCTGDYVVSAYYPTLYDMAVNINISSLNVPDGTVLYVNEIGAGGTLYPYTSNVIVILGGAGSCSEKTFVTLGASLAGVTITDANGAIVFAGN